MHIISELLPNPTVNKTVYNYSMGQSLPVPSTLDQHRQESEKWIEENCNEEMVMLLHPLEVYMPSFILNNFNCLDWMICGTYEQLFNFDLCESI